MKPAIRQVATVTRVAPNGKTVTGPVHWFAATDTLGKPFIRQHMTGHRGYIEPVPFTRGKVNP